MKNEERSQYKLTDTQKEFIMNQELNSFPMFIRTAFFGAGCMLAQKRSAAAEKAEVVN